MANELRHGETTAGNVLIEGPVWQRAFGRDQVHVGFLPDALAEVPELGNFIAGDDELTLRLEISLAGVFDVQFVQLRADFPPDAGFLRRVVDERRAELL